MQALSVFRGGFTRAAAHFVARASLRELRTLVNRSLVQATRAERYTMHELLRQYAEEQLERSPEVAELQAIATAPTVRPDCGSGEWTSKVLASEMRWRRWTSRSTTPALPGAGQQSGETSGDCPRPRRA